MIAAWRSRGRRTSRSFLGGMWEKPNVLAVHDENTWCPVCSRSGQSAAPPLLLSPASLPRSLQLWLTQSHPQKRKRERARERRGKKKKRSALSLLLLPLILDDQLWLSTPPHLYRPPLPSAGCCALIVQTNPKPKRITSIALKSEKLTALGVRHPDDDAASRLCLRPHRCGAGRGDGF